MSMEKAFLQYLERFGDDVQVTTRTPQMEEDMIKESTDDEGRTIFDEEINLLKAKINILQGNERIVENAILKPGDAIGKFKLSDNEYLNNDSFILIEFSAGIEFKFKIYDIIPKKTHLKILMRRI